jgi:hypothetical protein
MLCSRVGGPEVPVPQLSLEACWEGVPFNTMSLLPAPILVHDTALSWQLDIQLRAQVMQKVV